VTTAAVSGAEKLSSRHVLPRDLSNALKQLDDGELDRLFAATRHELQRRGADNPCGHRAACANGGYRYWDHSRPRDRTRFDHLRELQVNDISAAV
jgi:hypothetical protein